MQGNWVPSPEDEINHTLLLALASIFNVWQAPLFYEQDGKGKKKEKEREREGEKKRETSKLDVWIWEWLLLEVFRSSKSATEACKCSRRVGWTVLVEAGGGGFHKWPPVPGSCLSDGRVIWIRAATQGEVHYVRLTSPRSGCALPWRRQFKLKIWLSLCGVRNEHQMKHCSHGCHDGARRRKQRGCEATDTSMTLIKSELALIPAARTLLCSYNRGCTTEAVEKWAQIYSSAWTFFNTSVKHMDEHHTNHELQKGGWSFINLKIGGLKSH